MPQQTIGTLTVSEFMGLLFGVLFVWWFGEMALDWIATAAIETIAGLKLPGQNKSAEDERPSLPY